MSDDKKGMPRPLDDHAVDALLERIDLGFTRLGTFRGGEGPGAYKLAGPDGIAVLKVVDDQLSQRMPSVVRAVDVLRSRGYPAPRYLHMGSSGDVHYVIQQALPGEPIFDRSTPAHIARLLELNDMQADIAVDLPNHWPDVVAVPVLEGAEGFCLHETMRAHSEETSALLDELIALTSANVDGAPARKDIVHLDFTGANVLGTGDEITGVIDLEAVRLGDRAFDLVSFMYYVFENDALRSPLWRRALALSGPRAVKVYFAHMIFRQTEWSLRFDDATTVRDVLDRSRAVLDELAAL